MIDSIHATSFTLYDAAVLDSTGLRAIERLNVMSTEPITATVMTLEDYFAANGKAEDFAAAKDGWPRTLLDMLNGGGMKYVIKLETTGSLYSVSPAMGENKPVGMTYKPPMVVISKHDRWGDLSGWVPVSLFETFGGFKRDKAKVEGKDAKFMMQAASERVSKMMEIDRSFGRKIPEGAGAMVGLIGELSKLIEKASDEIKLDKRPKGNLGTFDGEDIKYVPARITQFTNVALYGSDGDGGASMNHLTVSHLADPSWHEADAEMKSRGFIGYWEYPRAAVSFSDFKRDSGGKVMVEFSGYRDLRVAVTSFDSIQPGGESGVPEMVWRALADDGAEPPTLMTEQESYDFDRSHAFNPGESLVSKARN